MGLAWWWDPCSSQNPRLADSTSESSVWGGQFGGPQERMNIWEELKDLCCVQHSATWLSLWVACRGNWNLWWRALVSVKLKRVTRSDYLVLMLWVYPRLTAQAFSREGDKEMQQLVALHQCQFFSQELDFAQYKMCCCLTSSCGLWNESSKWDIRGSFCLCPLQKAKCPVLNSWTWSSVNDLILKPFQSQKNLSLGI